MTKEPAPRTATGPALVNLLAKHLRGQQTHLIIFDDGHYLTHAMNRPDQNSAQGLLASICKTTKTEVMVVGQQLAKNLIVSDVLKDLKEQVYEVMSLPPPPRPEDCEDDAEEPPFMSFLRKLVAELDFGGPTDLLEWRVAIRIHSYARGRPGLVSALLQLGAKYAVAHKAGMVDMNILYLTLRDAMGVAHEDNVFRTTGNEPALVEYPGVFSLEPRYNV
ncbi:hypothetical protein [Devosia sp.]|uniref:hypothetical protein n=1 Tax=Devosia sp. TaxID=1871048 RepID=UPI0025EB8D74|nr:hypothetical protein [Devosia sp.]MCR6634760.1 hypothetical protein [Devosia sp.]